jgi:hypothetical protein
MKTLFKIGGLITILILFSSCFATKRRCYDKFPPQVSIDTSYYEVVRDSLVYRDTTIFVEIPGETLIDSIIVDNIPPETQKPSSKPLSISSDTIRLETEYAKAEAYYIAPKLYLKLEQKQSILEVKLDSVIRQEMHWKEMYMEIEKNTETKVKYIPTIYKIAMWGWAVVIGIIISLLLIRKFKP